MKIGAIAACVVSAATILLAGCGQSVDGAGDSALLMLVSSHDAIEEMSQSSLEAMNDGMSDINTTGAVDISYRMPCPARLSPGESLMAAEGWIMRAVSAEAATVSCPGGGSIDVTDIAGTWNDSAATEFNVTRTFNDCAGPYGLVSLSGSAVLNWSNMNTGTGVAKLKAGSVLKQAPVNKRFTRVSTGGYVTTEGNGEVLTSGDLTGTIAHTITWSAVEATTRAYQVDTDLTRQGFSSIGTRVYEHRISTPTPVDVIVDMSAGTRTVSGSIQVEHVLMGMSVTSAFASLVIPIDGCVPSSGNATIVISGAGDGNGTITYNGDGTASYTYSYTTLRGKTRSGSGSFAVAGCQ